MCDSLDLVKLPHMFALVLQELPECGGRRLSGGAG